MIITTVIVFLTTFFQMNPAKYKSILSGLSILVKEEGPHHFGEAGEASFLVMVFRVAASMVFTNISRSGTRTC
jgi:hypothetical protein